MNSRNTPDPRDRFSRPGAARQGIRRLSLGSRPRRAARPEARRREARLRHVIRRIMPPARLARSPVTTSPRVARDAFDWLESHAHDAKHGGYFEATRRDGTPILAWKQDARCKQRLDRLGVYYGFKSMNSHIHLLEAVTELKKIDDRPIVSERLIELLCGRARSHRRRAGRAQSLPDPRLAGDPCARLVRARRRDGLSAGRGRRGTGNARRPEDLAGRPRA